MCAPYCFVINAIEPSLPVYHTYGIETIPTALIFKNRDIVATITGAVPKRKVAEIIQAALEKTAAP
jgi:hypothetical protein